MSDAMEQEPRVQRAWQVISNAASPEGMEARILARVRSREEEMRSRRRWFQWRPMMLWAAAAALVAIVVSFAMMRHGGTTEERVVERASVVAPRESAYREVPKRTDVHADVLDTQRLRKRIVARNVVVPRFQNPPPLPLSEQERLLVALAQRPQLLPELTSIERTETVKAHGIGENSIFELSTQPLQPVQPAPLGDFE